MESVKSVTTEPSRVGSRKNSPMDIPMPRITETVTKTEAARSLPRVRSSHASKRDGSSVSPSSSGKNSAEYIRARTPSTMEATKVTIPRIRGRPSTGNRSLMNRSWLSRMARVPSGLRTTTACFFGPRIIMPSMSAWPPHMVLNPPEGQAQVFSLFCMGNCFSFVIQRQARFCAVGILPSFQKKSNSCRTYVSIGSTMVTRHPPPWAFPMSNRPSCRVTISSHTARPMPEPRALELPL